MIKNKIFFNEEVFNGEDTLFAIVFYTYANKIIKTDQAVYQYRNNYMSATKRKTEDFLFKKYKSYLFACIELKELLFHTYRFKKIIKKRLIFCNQSAVKFLFLIKDENYVKE